LFIAIIVALNPIKTKNSVLFLTTGISLSVFILFGVLAEIILTSVCLIVLLIKAKIRRDQHYRYPLNLVMFQILSLVTASIYTFTDSLLNFSDDLSRIFVLMVIYMIAHIIGNQAITFFIKKMFFNIKEAKIIDEDLFVSLSILVCIIPLSFILTFLFDQLQVMGAFIGALPFLTVSFGLNLFFKNKVNSTYAELVSDAAMLLSEKKTSEEVIENYMNQISKIFPTDALSLFKVTGNGTIYREYVYREDTGSIKLEEVFPVSDKSILIQALQTNTVKYFNCSHDWKSDCITDLSYKAESTVVLPVSIQNRVEGLVLLSHQSRNMYNSMLVSLIKSLHRYFVISLENSLQLESLDANSETDFLTGLPNLKSFSKKFEEALSKDNSKVSLIVLDLDLFKKINDKYGHQAGNEVLQHMAEVLKNFQKNECTVARYGGEEFVLLLPNVEKIEAGKIAEEIRETIASEEYEISQSIASKDPEILKVTASIGVATYPDDCSQPDELIAVADKAMYIGSKQQGRNRVTLASKGRNRYEARKIF
jgi:diguanylate cyclase (GGDEF)-like protein